MKIPKPDPENWLVEYFREPDGRFSHFQMVESHRTPHVGSSITVRSKVLDFTFVRRRKRYDKGGYKRFIREFKDYYFGSSDVRLTNARCEAFFDDPRNFALGVVS